MRRGKTLEPRSPRFRRAAPRPASLAPRGAAAAISRNEPLQVVVYAERLMTSVPPFLDTLSHALPARHTVQLRGAKKSGVPDRLLTR